MAYLALLMTFAAPVIQIVLCTLKLKNKINLNLIYISLLTLLLGIVLSIGAFYLLCSLINVNETRCVTGEAGITMCGFFITIVLTPLIAVIFATIAYLKNKNIKAVKTSRPYQNY